MAISADGRRLLVSASTANVVDVIDTATGKIVGTFPSGDSPHENNFSRDGKLIYHASIGTVYTDTDDPSMDATKGERVFEVVDARTLKVIKAIDMGEKLAEAGYPGMSAAVRPMAITPNERYVYFQVSFFFGIVKYDLRKDAVVDVLDLPLGDGEGHAAHRFPPRLRAPRARDEPRGDEALRRRDDVELRGDRHSQAVRAAAPGQGRQRAVLVGGERGRQVLLRLGRRQRPGRGDLVPDRPRGRPDHGRRPPAADADRA